MHSKKWSSLEMLSMHLPDDLVVEILKRLPVKSVLRLKTVSKSWCKQTKNHRFIVEHHETQKIVKNNNCILINHWRVHEKDWALSFFDNGLTPFRLVEDLPQFKVNGRSVTVVSPCNGVFCIFLHINNILLWNPALRQEKYLPESSMPKSKPPSNFRLCDDRVLGLSFDPKSNRYKVVRIWVFMRDSFNNRGNTPLTYADRVMNRAEVWTPGSKSWRKIDAIPPVPLSFSNDNGLNLKGQCYWLTSPLRSQVMVSFDMVHEVFRAIPLPVAYSAVVKEGPSYWYRAAILHDSIALLSSPLSCNWKSFEVWIMKENTGDQVSWSKHITVKKPLLKMVPLGFWKNKDLILRKGDGEITFLDTRTRETVGTKMYIANLQPVYVYEESLVSINGW